MSRTATCRPPGGTGYVAGSTAAGIDGFAQPGSVSVRFATEAPKPVDSED